MLDSPSSEAPASAGSVSALRADLQEVTCTVTNTRVALEQAIFALQDKYSDLRASLNHLQISLAHLAQQSLESRYQVSIARLETQQLQVRLEEAEARLSLCEQALDLHCLD